MGLNLLAVANGFRQQLFRTVGETRLFASRFMIPDKRHGAGACFRSLASVGGILGLPESLHTMRGAS